jgi:superfamily II DNA helicase RecQ
MTQTVFQEVVEGLMEEGVEEEVLDDVVEMFHGELDVETKNQITKEFASPNSNIRLLVSTVAFGLGVNIPDVRTVLHWGPIIRPPFLLAGNR